MGKDRRFDSSYADWNKKEKIMEIKVNKEVTKIGTRFIAEINDGKVKAQTSNNYVFRCPYQAVASLLNTMRLYYNDTFSERDNYDTEKAPSNNERMEA